MKKRPIRTVIYGESILLEGIETTLRKDPAFSVVQRLCDLTQLQQLPNSQYDLVIFDSTLPEAQAIPAIFNRSPELFVVGIDIPTDRLTLYSRKGYNIRDVSDFSHLVEDLCAD